MTGITLGQQHLNTANANQSMIHDDINYEHILSKQQELNGSTRQMLCIVCLFENQILAKSGNMNEILNDSHR